MYSAGLLRKEGQREGGTRSARLHSGAAAHSGWSGHLIADTCLASDHTVWAVDAAAALPGPGTLAPPSESTLTAITTSPPSTLADAAARASWRGGVRRHGGCRQRQRREALVEVGGEGGVDKGRAGAVTAAESHPCW